MNVLIVEDHPILYEPIRAAVVAEGGCVVGQTGSGTEAVTLAAHLQPDIIVLDLQLDDLNGFTAAEQILGLFHRIRILVMSGTINDQKVLRTQQLRLPGYIHKRVANIATIRTALGALYGGRTFYCPVFQDFIAKQKSNFRAGEKLLSPVEIQVLAHIGCGSSDEEIAAALGKAHSTVTKHRSNLLHKLSIPGSPQLVRYSIDHGYADDLT
jgi:two-component system nitrate/nitrite response regulator NarL